MTELPIIRISGPSDSGKTTLIEQLLPRLRARGLRVGTIKHAHHGFDLDHPGKDSWRHAEAGAEAVAIVSPERTVWFLKTAVEPAWPEVVERMRGHVDLILLEGFKSASVPVSITLAPGAPVRVAVDAADCRIGVPPLDLTPDEMNRLVEFCASLTMGARS